MKTLSLFLFIFYLFSTFSFSEPTVSIKVPKIEKQHLNGESLFNKNCVSCHGINGAGINGVGPPLIHKIYEPSHHGDQSFYSAIKYGVKSHHWNFGNMAAVKEISDEEIVNIINYIRFIQESNGIK
ncbi:cytochrome c [bacterium]|jgi:cytochrome c2|nr:cytochrome c [bacterium]